MTLLHETVLRGGLGVKRARFPGSRKAGKNKRRRKPGDHGESKEEKLRGGPWYRKKNEKEENPRQQNRKEAWNSVPGNER